MLRVQRLCAVLAATLLLSATGCDTPDTVSKFCASSSTTLTSAIPIFQDLEGSCLREKNLAEGIGTFEVVTTDANCDLIGKQGDGAIAAVKILADYFSAINSLATFGTAKTASDASTLVTKTAAAVGAATPAQIALGDIATFLTTAATSGYQQKSLDKDLSQVSANIGAVTDALVTIVQRNYIGQQLKPEAGNLASHYKEFAVKNPGAPAVTIELDDRWHADAQTLATRQASAESLITALNAIKKGSADLAVNAKTVQAKELQSLLDPYVTQLQTLIPQIQKGF
jgi:hypothetical protein